MICIFLIVLIVLVIVYSRWEKKPEVKPSKIQGSGLFATKDYKEGEVILDNVFPHKPPDLELYDPIGEEKFNKYMSFMGSKINHCSNKYNTDLITSDYTSFPLIAVKNINKGSEILANYKIVNSNFPFIAPPGKDYFQC